MLAAAAPPPSPVTAGGNRANRGKQAPGTHRLVRASDFTIAKVLTSMKAISMSSFSPSESLNVVQPLGRAVSA